LVFLLLGSIGAGVLMIDPMLSTLTSNGVWHDRHDFEIFLRVPFSLIWAREGCG
jgi:hypothetical protein